MTEGRELSRQFGCAGFHEVSVADNPVETVAVMNRVVRHIWRQKVLLVDLPRLVRNVFFWLIICSFQFDSHFLLYPVPKRSVSSASQLQRSLQTSSSSNCPGPPPQSAAASAQSKGNNSREESPAKQSPQDDRYYILHRQALLVIELRTT